MATPIPGRTAMHLADLVADEHKLHSICAGAPICGTAVDTQYEKFISLKTCKISKAERERERERDKETDSERAERTERHRDRDRQRQGDKDTMEYNQPNESASESAI